MPLSQEEKNRRDLNYDLTTYPLTFVLSAVLLALPLAPLGFERNGLLFLEISYKVGVAAMLSLSLIGYIDAKFKVVANKVERLKTDK